VVEIVEEQHKHDAYFKHGDPIGALFLVTLAGLAIPGTLAFGKYWWPRIEPYLKRIGEGIRWVLAPKRTVVEYERDAEGRIIRTKEWKEPI